MFLLHHSLAYLPFAICHLPFAICHSISFVCCLKHSIPFTSSSSAFPRGSTSRASHSRPSFFRALPPRSSSTARSSPSSPDTSLSLYTLPLSPPLRLQRLLLTLRPALLVLLLLLFLRRLLRLRHIIPRIQLDLHLVLLLERRLVASEPRERVVVIFLPSVLRPYSLSCSAPCFAS